MAPAKRISRNILLKLSGTPPAATSLALKAGKQPFGFQPLYPAEPGKRGLGVAPAQPDWFVATPGDGEGVANAWDICHEVMQGGMGLAAGFPEVHFAEPDLEQQWPTGSEAQLAMAAGRTCDKPADPDKRLPFDANDLFWFRNNGHSELEAARNAVGEPGDRVRIAHLDTGYDPAHETLPEHLRKDLQKNFVDPDRPDNAEDDTSGLLNNLGHGTGTLGILAGAQVDGSPLGGAPFLDVIPIRVANRVVLFQNSAIAKALNYVRTLFADPANRAHVITMSMGGLASQVWAEQVNALYELGVFIVTAAGNNFANLPTRNIVYPARFNRVVAACGVMADGSPYADLAANIMAGNYGPSKKMDTAMAAFTPNTPWAKLGCATIVDHDGRGTSSSTPQIAAAAGLWIQKNKAAWEKYPNGWMRVEAVRKALFDAAVLANPSLRERLGRGVVHANAALGIPAPSPATLQEQPVDSASFPLLRVLTGLGLAARTMAAGASGSALQLQALDSHHQMLELEALQLTQRSKELETLLPDPEIDPARLSESEKRRIADALINTPGASDALRRTLGGYASTARPQVAVPQAYPEKAAERARRAANPVCSTPPSRPLRVFAFDPLLSTKLDTVDINETTLSIRWEDLTPGPIGEYIEVIDVDPSSGCAYAPVDLNQPLPLTQGGFQPSESNPRFHQQMAYAVAMKTIEHFEHALGRVALWSPRIQKDADGQVNSEFVQRLRIYPHALREANSYYSPDKHALLFGYFQAAESSSEMLPGGVVFCCLSHDVVAHETTHALLDGLHRRFREATNPDILAFHEAFADLVALFQHFTVPEALREQIGKTQGDLARQNILGELAQEFGAATGHGALRSAIGYKDQDDVWHPTIPKRTDYANATEPHARGAVLVAAVFDAFLAIYKRRSEDLIRLATAGTGVLPEGAIPHDLVTRLAEEASKTATHVLNICIRALDYCPPVDLTFGDYIRALVTADRDLVPDDPIGYRVAFLEGFRKRGIYPEYIKNLSTDAACWEPPEIDVPLKDILSKMDLGWDLHANRREAYERSKRNAAKFHEWLFSDSVSDDVASAIGIYRNVGSSLTVNGMAGTISKLEVHSVRPVRRVGPDDEQRLDLVVEITQKWEVPGNTGLPYRGGCTLLIDLEKQEIRYCIRKRVAHPERITKQDEHVGMAAYSLRGNYFGGTNIREPFALIHRG